MSDYRFRFIIYLFLLALALFVAWVVSSIFYTPITAQMGSESLTACFYTAPRTIQPDTYVLGTRIPENVNFDKLIEVLKCESNLIHIDRNGNIIRGKDGEYGIAQFKQETWNWFNELRETNLDILNMEDQLDMIKWAFNNGYQEQLTSYSINN